MNAYVIEILRLRIWIIPAVSAIVAGAAAVTIVWIEETTDSLGILLDIDVLSARATLSAISTAMISFTALVFSVTMLVLQLAGAQLSPRVMRTFLRDRFNQIVLGLFVATFVFSLLVLVSLRSDFVPQLGVLAAILFVLVAVFAFVAYIDHMAHSIRASSVIGSIGDETRAALDRAYPEADEGDRGDETIDLPEITGLVRSPHRSGYVVLVHEDALVAHAEKEGCVLELLVTPGAFIVRDEPLLAIRGSSRDIDAEPVARAIQVGEERTMAHDPAFGFRQLVDIALRALSPGINDPTTANQAIDRIHALLRHLQSRIISAPRVLRTDGKPRVIIPARTWEDYVLTAVGEIHGSSRHLPQVTANLRDMLDHLASDAGRDQLPTIRRALHGLESAEPSPLADASISTGV